MDCMAAICRSRAGCRVRAQAWPYSGLAQLLILVIVLILGSHPLSPERARAQAAPSSDLAPPAADDALAFTSPASSANAQTLPESLGVALAFNLFIIGDLTQHHSITYGRIAAGGNATLERYRIGDTLPRARDNRADLIVGGTLVFTDGLVAKGGVIAGGKASLAGVGIPHGQLREGLPLDFGAQGAALTRLAASLGQLPSTGITQIRERRDARKQITLIGTDRQLNIFALTGGDLASAQTLIISVPRTATVLVNIDGAAGRIQDIGFAIGTINRNHILYNFYQATELTLNDDRIQGSILAPQARVTFVKGRVNGTLIGGSLSGSGLAWPDPFIGQLPSLPED